MLGLILAVVIGLVITISALADYGHPIVAYNPNPVSITFPRAGKIVLWNVITSGSPGYFSRYYFIRNGCNRHSAVHVDAITYDGVAQRIEVDGICWRYIIQQCQNSFTAITARTHVLKYQVDKLIALLNGKLP